ncbi:hypothetical protein F5Y03DRAFT_319883 [Xylaria venustula]|nr:hypothetical protein F5Y03DRAFT_319883 [Xylaria venustula]
MATLPSLTAEPTRHPGCCVSLSQPLLATIQALLQSIPSASLQKEKSDPEYESAPQPLILSVGSGSGLLEELLQLYLNQSVSVSPNWRVEGVEVNSAVNIHLPEDRINQVAGTWAVLESRARDAAALMFVYPRDGALVRRYIDAFMTSSLGTRYSGGKGIDEQEGVNGRKSDGGPTGEEDKRVNESANDRYKNGNGGRVQLVLWLGPKCDWEDTGIASSDARGDFEVVQMRDGVGLAEYEMLAVLRRKDSPAKLRR